MKTIKIPSFLHDVFGLEQNILHLLVIIAFGISLPIILFIQYPILFSSLPLWKSIIAILLITDIAAGFIANFTKSTNNFYAKRPKNRWICIAIHFHVIIVAYALNMELISSIIVWAFTIISAIIINLLKGFSSQIFWAGVLISIGITGIILFSADTAELLIIQILFLLKVVFSFAVDHYDT